MKLLLFSLLQCAAALRLSPGIQESSLVQGQNDALDFIVCYQHPIFCLFGGDSEAFGELAPVFVTFALFVLVILKLCGVSWGAILEAIFKDED